MNTKTSFFEKFTRESVNKKCLTTDVASIVINEQKP